MGESRVLPAGRLRLGMVLANGLMAAEIARPPRGIVKRGYGRVRIGFDDGQVWNYYPDDRITLAKDEDAPADPTMDDWPGAWWPTAEDGNHYERWRNRGWEATS